MTTPAGSAADRRVAVVTSSYRGDLERCGLLCESIDRFVTGHTCHYILVEHRDRALFQALSGPRRRIVSEREILPFWLRPIPDPVNPKRRLWLSPVGPPLRGWHVQQLRRIAVAAAMDEDALLSVDSDVVFVRPFDVGDLARHGRVRFHRVPGEAHRVTPDMAETHRAWSRMAGRLLGIAAPAETDAGYIATVIAWRRDTVRDMLARIEASTGRSAMAALAGTRTLSECTIYGRFADEVENRPDRHAPTADPLCRIYWNGPAMDAAALERLVAAMAPGEVAIGVQSFTATDPALIRRVAGLG